MEWGKSLPHETLMWLHILPQPDVYLLFIYLLIINLAYDFCLFVCTAYIFTILYTYFECSLLDPGVGFGQGQTFSNFPCDHLCTLTDACF